MGKLTDEQIRQIDEAREKILEKLDIFKLGLLFPEMYAEQLECPRKQWIEAIIVRVKALDVKNWELNCESLYEYTDFEIGMKIERYFGEIREVFLQEFNKIIEPFSIALLEYQSTVCEVLKNQ